LTHFAAFLRLVVLEAIQGEKKRLPTGDPEVAKWVNYEAWQLSMYARFTEPS